MRVSVGKMCRGCGFAYITVEVRKDLPQSDARVETFSEKGVRLPAESYRYPGFSGDGAVEKLVVVIPALSTSKVVLRVAEVAAAGDEVACVRRSISRERIKWSSRLNYRLHNAEMHRIRDIEKRVRDGQIEVRCFTAAELRGIVTVKGFISTPSDEPSPTLRLVDGAGNEVEDHGAFVGITRPATVDGATRLETSFTVRVPMGFAGCIVAESAVGHKTGMLPLDGVNLGRLMHEHDPRFFYCAARPDKYALLRKRWERSAGAAYEGQDASICFSVIVPLFRTPIPFFEEMCESVLRQTYPNWELVLVNASPEDEALARAAEGIDDQRVKVVPLEENLGIAQNTNVGIAAATGDFIAFFDHDDLLEPDALAEYAKALRLKPDTCALYCDEDLLNEHGEFVSPHFKSDFNIDLLRCHNYITHFLAVRADVARRLLLNEAYDGAQDYDFILRIAEEGGSVEHVGKVLYHWRMHSNSTAANPESKAYANEAGRRALEDHLGRCGLPSQVTLSPSPFVYHVAYEVQGNPLVSIIIPNKDNIDVLRGCLDSLFEKTTYGSYEVIVVENNSRHPETFEYYRELEANPKVRVVVWEHVFNYSAINNFAETFAQGEYLLFLNNDVEVIEPNWLTAMLSYCQRKDVGIAGARLLYADDTVQHAGVFMSKCSSADDSAGPNHIFMHLDKYDEGYMNRAVRPQDLSAVTAACMLTKRSVFRKLNGFDEDFVVAYNDIDYCLRVREEGLLVVYVPDALLYHYESLSRGPDDESSGLANYARFLSEQGLMRARWSKYYAAGDPYHGKFASMKVNS